MGKNICVTVFYDKDLDYQYSFQLLKKMLCGIKFDAYIISNNYSNEIAILHKGEIQTIHNPELNTEMEFSGYIEGVKFFYSRFNEKDSAEHNFYFLNDTLFKHGKLRKVERIAFWEWKIKLLLRGFSKSRKCMIGFKHKSIFLKNTEMEHGYCNSKLFILYGFTLQDVITILAPKKIDVKLVDGSVYQNNIFPSFEYCSFLHCWLHSDGGWYKAQELNERNKDVFLKKAKSIIHEHYMTYACKRSLIDINCMIHNSKVVALISKMTGFKY